MKKMVTLLCTAAAALVLTAGVSAKFVPVDLSKYFNNDGITALGATGEEGFDRSEMGAWASYDAAYFPVGGGELKVSMPLKDVTFVLGPTTGTAKNNVEVAGQEIAVVPGNYKAIYLMAASHNGPSENAPITIKYSDGTSDVVTVSVTDWCGEPKFDETPFASMDHRVELSGKAQGLSVYLSGVQADVDPSKTVTSIVLPADTLEFNAFKFHVFAATLETK